MKLTLRNYNKFDKTTTYDISVSKQSSEEAAAGVGVHFGEEISISDHVITFSSEKTTVTNG
jgi:hypothetical protein